MHAKYAPPLLVSTAFIDEIDWLMVAAILFAFVAGWAARAAISLSEERSRRYMMRDFFISLLSSFGAMLIVVGAVRQFDLDWHAAAVLAFTLSMGGISALGLFTNTLRKSAEKALGAWRWVDDHRKADERMRFDKRPPAKNHELDDLAKKLDE